MKNKFLTRVTAFCHSRVSGNFLLFGVALLITGSIIYLSLPPRKNISLAPVFSTDFAYESSSFLPAIAGVKKTRELTAPKIIVIPHHLTASSIIAQGIYSLRGSTIPGTIFIFSPLHSNTGNCDIVTSSKSWNTPYGTVDVNKSLQTSLFASRSFCIDDKAFEPEHGIAGLLPFIKYFYPQAEIIPFALKKYIDPSNLQSFINSLNSLDNKNVSFISSLDFSHNLSLNQSQARDKQTEKLISDNNYSQIEKLTQENVDNPPSLIIAMHLAENIGSKLQIVNHKNSSDFNNSTTSVTSYFFLANSQSSPTKTPSPSLTPKLTTSIFPSSAPVPPGSTTLLFGGDVMLARSVNTRMIKYGDYTWPFLKIANTLKNADLTMVNLESPFKSGCSSTDTGMIFCADPKSIAGLTFAGIDIVNLANNHILNQGQVGLDETVSLLNANNISLIGMKKPLFKTVNNTKIAFIGFNDIGGSGDEISTATPQTIKSQITSAKASAQIVVATFHFGNEYSKRSLRQQELAHLAIDSGADIVIGHHPHWVQEYEDYKGKPIYYSLGNLVFDQMWSTETRKGLIVKITIKENQVINVEQIPVMINDYGQPSIE